ncbi:hypothetical protein MRB53_028929 [Persea americana]|uniref:Uncharacterized protein n=1 Tax=Persea americana TaxID=3435 RepID=A0ACC2KGY6_PERAE|nr:hypothetical protein MRB53_028929 [Persea americana]
MQNCSQGPEISAKVLDMLFTIYSDVKVFDLASETFDFMKSNGWEIDDSVLVYSMTIIVGGLCKKGEVKRARELVVEMSERGIKPNAVTYTILIDGLSGLGRVEKAEKLFEQMSPGWSKQDFPVWTKQGILFHTSIIDASCRVGNMKRAFALFDECIDRGIDPNALTYGALINGLFKSGQVEAAKILLNGMQE